MSLSETTEIFRDHPLTWEGDPALLLISYTLDARNGLVRNLTFMVERLSGGSGSVTVLLILEFFYPGGSTSTNCCLREGRCTFLMEIVHEAHLKKDATGAEYLHLDIPIPTTGRQFTIQSERFDDESQMIWVTYTKDLEIISPDNPAVEIVLYRDANGKCEIQDFDETGVHSKLTFSPEVLF